MLKHLRQLSSKAVGSNNSTNASITAASSWRGRARFYESCNVVKNEKSNLFGIKFDNKYDGKRIVF